MKKNQISCLKIENAKGVEGRWRSMRGLGGLDLDLLRCGGSQSDG